MLSAPESLPRLLARVFSRSSFRFGQQAAIQAVLAGRDALVCLPTGAGKSLCFQLAAVALAQRCARPSWVISPLLALMNDQVSYLTSRGVRALAWHSGHDSAQAAHVWQQLTRGDYDIAYLSPERAVSPPGIALARAHRLALLAVDEAHCISQWGHDFRPEYRALAPLRRAASMPVMAVTATATRATLDDIAQSLHMVRPQRVLAPARRDTLALQVAPPAPIKERLARLPGYVRTFLSTHRSGALIVYAATRKTTEQAVATLAAANLPVPGYHAGLPLAARVQLERDFLCHKLRCLVATCAFGMGIDRSDVRTVLHLQCPARLEALVQEAGRAGRDGQAATCALWWGPQDWLVQRQLTRALRAAKAREAAEQGLAAMQAYVRTRMCRQVFLSAHFDSPSDAPCGTCDVCCGQVAPTIDASLRAPLAALLPRQAERIDAALLQIMAHARRPVGRGALTLAVRGSTAQVVRAKKLDALPGAGAAAGVPAAHIEARIAALLAAGRLVPRGRKYPTLWLAGRPQRGAGGRGTPTKRPPKEALQLALERYSRHKARELNWPKAYMVLPKKVMKTICAQRPADRVALRTIAGFGDKKVAMLGDDIVALVRMHAPPAVR